MFAAGFGTFARLYVVQRLLPLVGRLFEISPAATSSLTLAASTAGLAVCVLPLARLSERYGSWPGHCDPVDRQFTEAPARFVV
jgi:YNFM family putative membrane transporter